MYLIGDIRSKRSTFFDKAAAAKNLKVHHIDWQEIRKDFDFKRFEGVVVKLDPPSYNTYSVTQAKEEINVYIEKLKLLSDCGAVFLNTPDAILSTLNKRNAKIILENLELPVTPFVMKYVENTEHLITKMKEKNIFSVFIKPVNFSGAAGVVAFRLNKKSGKMKAYTSCKMQNGTLINTKHLYVLEDNREITMLLDEIIKLDVIVERWVPKGMFEGKSYDLRIVYQFGHDVMEVARGSSGPITNLHLNNIAISAKDIWEIDDIKEKNIYSDVIKLCENAVSAFDGLSVAGVDLLIEKSTLKPRIIEINGQGDLIYKDIYDKNNIYIEQAAVCSKLEKRYFHKP